MPTKEKSLKAEVCRLLKSMQTIHLATSDGKKPKVRPVTLICYNKKYWVATFTGCAKFKQLQKNPNFELLLLLPKDKSMGYIRGGGKARIVKDAKTKTLLAKNIPFFKEFWKSAADPGFALLELKISAIEYMRPGEFLAHNFSL